MQITRQYHSTALLLADGRVLTSGGGICGTCDQVGYLGKNAEVFSPPYLFESDGTLAPRPVIDAAPASVSYGAPIEIATGNPASIGKVALVRLGADTHSVDMEQRYVPLLFTAGATSLTATAPANANVAPPGPYMLFIVNANGVPSVARMVTVQGGGSPPTVTLTQPANGANFTAPATVGLAATASDADGTVARVEFFNGAVEVGEDTIAPYSFSWGGVGAGDLHGDRARHRQPRRHYDERAGHDHRQRRKHGADCHAYAAGERRELHGPGDGGSGGDGVRCRRHGGEGRVLQRRGGGRGGHDRAL